MDEMFENPNMLASSVVTTSGDVEEVEGGYRWTGKGLFSSGVDHCSWLTTAVPADHALAGRTTVAAAELAEERWINDDLYETSCSVIRNRVWRSAGFSPGYVARAADSHAGIAFVGAGVGILVLPRLAVGTPPPTVAVLDIEPCPQRRIVMHVREGSDANPAVARAVETLEQVSTSG